MDPCSCKRGSLAGASQDRQAGFSTQGIWAALSPRPASSHMSKVRSFECFRELDYDRKYSAHGELPLPSSPAASSPIQAAPGYRYTIYHMHEQKESDRMRYGQSAPMDVLPPFQWRNCRKQREGKERRACRDKVEEAEEDEEEEKDVEEEEEKEVDKEQTMAMRGGACRGCGSGQGGKERLPPHELLAREWAAATSCGGSAFSLCQGVGRTLKGRDLCRVRNAILKQTGFI